MSDYEGAMFDLQKRLINSGFDIDQSKKIKEIVEEFLSDCLFDLE